MTPKEKLLAHTGRFKPETVKIGDGIYTAFGYSASNSTMIQSESGIIIIDTHESKAAAERALNAYREIDERPVVAVVFTHSHRDHVGGAAVFAQGGDPEIIARPTRAGYGAKEIGRIAQLRQKKGLGIGLRPAERLSLGIGPGEKDIKGLGNGGLPPTYLVRDDDIEVEIDGVSLELVAAPGESDDTLLVWVPEKQILICGDNFYHSFPSLYSLWGERRRDLRRWIDSLEMMIEFEAEVLVPGHTHPVFGKEEIKTTLSNYHAALVHIHTEVVNGINKGFGPDDLIDSIELPAHLAELPYLQEFYGSLAWGIRAIYSDYLGWFDGNPTNLLPLSPLEAGIRIANLVGGEDMLLARLKKLLRQNDPKDWQWGLQLADYLIALGSFEEEALDLKADLLLLLADEQENAVARNWYIYSARELRREV